jgi:hypothetical protein
MGNEKKYDGAGDPFKMFLKESLARKRNKMMDNFPYSSRGHAIPFKVHVNFDISLFEGLIDVYVVDKWSSLLEG